MRDLAFFISGHGHGHAVRQSFLINALPSDIHPHIITSLDRSFFNEEIKRPFSYRQEFYDCGAIQSNALSIDIEKTLLTYGECVDRGEEQFEEELSYLKKAGVLAILSDIVPIAGPLGKSLGIPVVGVSNFTWYDIYKEWGDHPLLDNLYGWYSDYTHWVSLYPGLIISPEIQKGEVLRDVALFRSGRDIRESCYSYYNIPRDKKLVLLYLGCYGHNRVDWSALEELSDYQFLSVYPPEKPINNFTSISKEFSSLQDISASAHVILSKPGYGTTTESLSSGTPFLVIPRYDFAEYPALLSDLLEFGAVEITSEEKFCRGDIAKELDKLSKIKRDISIDSGISKIVRWIDALLDD